MSDFRKISLESTINSGQVFLWKKQAGFWYGVNGQDVLQVSEGGKVRSYQNSRTDFFRKKDDMGEIIRSISRDRIVSMAIKEYSGLRILRQDPFQCLISFIASSNSNIQKIRLSLDRLSSTFGRRIEFDQMTFHMFPKPKSIADATIEEIKECGLGYRSKFVLEAARMVESRQINLERLKKCDYQEAKEAIRLVPGVGDKVADCIMLFALDKMDAFPLDRWMLRILGKYYSGKFVPEVKSITHKQYRVLHEKIIGYFGPYAGYAQQFLFKMERERNKKKWL